LPANKKDKSAGISLIQAMFPAGPQAVQKALRRAAPRGVRQAQPQAVL